MEGARARKTGKNEYCTATRGAATTTDTNLSEFDNFGRVVLGKTTVVGIVRSRSHCGHHLEKWIELSKNETRPKATTVWEFLVLLLVVVMACLETKLLGSIGPANQTEVQRFSNSESVCDLKKLHNRSHWQTLKKTAELFSLPFLYYDCCWSHHTRINDSKNEHNPQPSHRPTVPAIYNIVHLQ